MVSFIVGGKLSTCR